MHRVKLWYTSHTLDHLNKILSQLKSKIKNGLIIVRDQDLYTTFISAQETYTKHYLVLDCVNEKDTLLIKLLAGDKINYEQCKVK